MSDSNQEFVTLPSGRLMSRRRFIQAFGITAAAEYQLAPYVDGEIILW